MYAQAHPTINHPFKHPLTPTLSMSHPSLYHYIVIRYTLISLHTHTQPLTKKLCNIPISNLIANSNGYFYLHTYTHAYTYAYTYSHAYSHALTYTNAYTHACTHTYTLAYTHLHARIRTIHTHLHLRINTINIYAYTYAHTRTLTRTHTRCILYPTFYLYPIIDF